MRQLLFVYINRDIEHNPQEYEEVKFNEDIPLIEYLRNWQQAHPEQALIEVYEIKVKHELYGKYHDIDSLASTYYP